MLFIIFSEANKIDHPLAVQNVIFFLPDDFMSIYL